MTGKNILLFDVGVANYLSRRAPRIGTPEFGNSFEHYILMELYAYQAYKNPELDIRFWRTNSGFEVDVILGDMDLAVDVKGSGRIHRGHTRGLRALQEEHSIGQTTMVSLEKQPRRLDSTIYVMPWQIFLEVLWSGGFGV